MNKLLVILISLLLLVTVFYGCDSTYDSNNPDQKPPVSNERPNLSDQRPPGQSSTGVDRPSEPIVGNDRDEHGCIGSAGYVWCESLEKCVRPWEEKCEGLKLTDKPPKDDVITAEKCEQAGGYWNECTNPCSIDNQGVEGAICTLECRQMCTCGTIAGYVCPPEFKCKMPEGIPDAQGYCVPAEQRLLENQ